MAVRRLRIHLAFFGGGSLDLSSEVDIHDGCVSSWLERGFCCWCATDLGEAMFRGMLWRSAVSQRPEAGQTLRLIADNNL